MAEDMEGFTQISLLNIQKIHGFLEFGLNEFVDQVLHSLAIMAFRPCNLIEKNRIETGERFVLDSLDAVIYNQRRKVKKSMNLIAAVVK
jgi:hypothetical protein